jgi:hypothetical protein
MTDNPSRGGACQPRHGPPHPTRALGGVAQTTTTSSNPVLLPLAASNPVLNGNLHYPLPSDVDKPINEAAADKIRDYRAD